MNQEDPAQIQFLIHLPLLPHATVNLVSISSDNGSSPIQRHAII